MTDEGDIERAKKEDLPCVILAREYANQLNVLNGIGYVPHTGPDKMTYDCGKRAFDVAASGLALVVLAIPLLFVAALVRVFMGAPVLFRQPRPGLQGRIFMLIKFRTMRDELGPDGRALPDAKRLTGFGRFLRKTSLDELPELWNVLCGDMSLVGPRPLLIEYLPYYSLEQQRRHDVRPGLTGWAQVNGRNAQTWDERFKLDLEYIDRRSFGFDLRILFLTIWSVLSGHGVENEPGVPMRRFDDEMKCRAGSGKVGGSI